MAFLWISEYKVPGRNTAGGALQLAKEPAHAEQRVTFSGHARSNAFNQDTICVHLISDTDCHIRFGTNPTASGETQFLPANTGIWREITKGGNQKVGVVAH